jgi:8-amino-7-oxononanoate synthase
MIKSYIEKYIDDVKSKNLYRNLDRRHASIDFSSNDYLGLSHNKASLESGYTAAKLYGSGSTGSRLLSGNKEIFEIFERQIAFDKNFESSLIFNSGFVANASVISALSIPESIMIFDKLNHASMYCGTDSLKTKLLRYKHLDYDELESILKKHNFCENKIIVSETVFGMDGDVANLSALSYLSQKYGALLFLDEAHATGLYGKNGCGVSVDFDLDPSSTIVMGTFSKALSSSGAYVAGSNFLKEYLVQKCKGFIYSTALSPFCIGVAQYNWNLMKTMDDTRRRIIKLADEFRKKIAEYGYETKGTKTNIVPIIFSNTSEMLDVSAELLKTDVVASSVRPPTSPRSRIRFAVRPRYRLK